MARGSRKKKRRFWQWQGLNFAVTLVTVSIIFIFLGYLVGQYAVQIMRDDGVTTLNRAEQQDVVSQEIARGLSDQEAEDQPLESSRDAPLDETAPPESPGEEVELPMAEEVDDGTTVDQGDPHTGDTDETESDSPTGLYRVHLGTFSDRDDAEDVKNALLGDGFPAIVLAGPPYRVQSGAFSSRENAERYAAELEEHGFEPAISQ